MGVNNLQNISKRKFRGMVKQYIFRKNQAEVVESTRGYKKLNYDEISKQEYKRKPYFYNMSLENGRMAFKVNTKTVHTIPANFSAEYRRKGKRAVLNSAPS